MGILGKPAGTGEFQLVQRHRKPYRGHDGRSFQPLPASQILAPGGSQLYLSEGLRERFALAYPAVRG